MKYLIPDENGILNTKKYFDYIHSIKEKVPKSVYDFASNDDHYNLLSHDSLHDAWLNFFEIREDASGARSENRKAIVNIELLAPFHDKKIHLKYKIVRRVSIEQKECNVADGHGDLLIHEFRLGEESSIIHEIVFDHGGTYLIEFEDFEFNYEDI